MRDWLVDYRTKAGLTQAQMAKKLNISEAYYSYIEKGERQKKMDLSLVFKLSDIFCITAQQIVEHEKKWSESQNI